MTKLIQETSNNPIIEETEDAYVVDGYAVPKHKVRSKIAFDNISDTMKNFMEKQSGMPLEHIVAIEYKKAYDKEAQAAAERDRKWKEEMDRQDRAELEFGKKLFREQRVIVFKGDKVIFSMNPPKEFTDEEIKRIGRTAKNIRGAVLEDFGLVHYPCIEYDVTKSHPEYRLIVFPPIKEH